MALAAGTKLGPYEILAPIGAGGMGEVYRAHDTKLDRDVAIKILPESFARDPERAARFDREAKVLAALNHPNIAQIYGLEERALIMELVEGPTLADRIAQGALPLDEALGIAKQIAEALEAAHEKGITHRDLKPANVKITPAGVVKVLDFGLAAAAQSLTPAGNPSISPTLTLDYAATRPGMIMGTAAYMSPEQASGKPVDKRADIWSFGVVLWEMLTGKRLFDGETISHTLAAVLTKEPELNQVPAKVRRLLAKCLEKDSKRRLRDISSVGLLLEETPQITASASSRTKSAGWIAAGALFVTMGILGFFYFRQSPPAKAVLRYAIAAPEGTSGIHSFALSPDGRLLVIAAIVNGKRQLWLRPLDVLEAQPMPGTEAAVYPFWSPDSRYIGFFAQGKLKKIAASGGPAQSICDIIDGQGGSWSPADEIVFSPALGAGIVIQHVSAAEGIPAAIGVTGASGPTAGLVRLPIFLPDGRRFLYLLTGSSGERNGVYLSSLDGRENRRVLADASSVVLAAGRLLFIRENTLMAQSFDGASGQTVGEAVPVTEGLSLVTNNYAPITASETGVLLYQSGGTAGGNNQMAWFDRSGKFLGAVGAPGPVLDPAISPDEKTVVFRRGTLSNADLWLRDFTRGTEQRFTTDPSINLGPFWSPTGDRIVFASTRSGVLSLYEKAASGTGKDELLLPHGNTRWFSQWSRDGEFAVYAELDSKTKFDIWVLPMAAGKEERKPVPFLRSEFSELMGQLSPDSHWMAYTSDESGQREVYVRPFPTGDGQWRISIAGGEQPRWRGDGKELFFVAADGKMMAVLVKAVTGAAPSIEAGVPQPLFDAHLAPSPVDNLFEYDVTADGKRFLVDTVGLNAPATVPSLNVIVNWDAGLKK